MMPALFLAHGAPTFALEENAVTRFWAGLPQLLPATPKAILCISGHWETTAPEFSSSTSVQHDFFGFPDTLYQLAWPLAQDPAAAAWMRKKLAELEIDVTETARPLDHGVWVPLRTAWPAPAFPVCQLSLCPQQGPLWHVELGRKLAPLRGDGVLVVGTGGISHNLGRIDWRAKENEATDWAAVFVEAVDSAIAHGDVDALCDPWGLPHGREAVPSLDHYLPLLVILGMAGETRLSRLHAGWSFGSLAMHSYGLGMGAGA